MVKHLGNSLVDLLYIFDEPSIGMHPKDLDNIIKIIQKLEIREIVFYWLNMILILLEQLIMSLICTLSGINGGEIIYQGTFEELKIHQV